MEKRERRNAARRTRIHEKGRVHEVYRYAGRLKDRFRTEEEESTSEEAVRAGEETAYQIYEGGSNLVSRRLQKTKQHRVAVNKENAERTKDFWQWTKEAVRALSKEGKELAIEAVKHPGGLIAAFGIVLFLVFLGMLFSSCSVLGSGIGSGTLGASFTAREEEIYSAESFYQGLENGLADRIGKIEEEYPGFDEYRVEADEVFHNPFTLTAFLTVKFEDFTCEEITETMAALFSGQYDLTRDVVVETRYREEEQEVTVKQVDEAGKAVEVTTAMTVAIPYEYRILQVTLVNRTLETAVEEWGLSAEEKDRYYLLLTTGGGRSGLFDGNPYAFSVSGLEYEIPGEALSDVRFARMVEEGRKYLGYPYVWGGESPATSFDCSGFVSWVLNHCGNGWDFGRLTAEELREACRIIRASEARPGDLVFFQGTYATKGASHVGIYVGEGMMLHCGNPVQFASFETEYWKSHFYCFGRLP